MPVQPEIDSEHGPWERRISNDAVTQATGREWDEWFRILDDAGAREMPHAQIATYLKDSGLLPQAAWWGQMIAVAYEQFIGRREAGQNYNGVFTATASKILSVSMDNALARWEKSVAGKTEFGGVPLSGQPAASMTEKWRYWRAGLVDSSRINVNISARAAGKTLLQVEHLNTGSQESSDIWKAFWKDHLSLVG